MLVEGDLGWYKSATMGANFSTASVGGGRSTTLITGNTIGEIHFAMVPNALAGGSLVQNQKICFTNTSTTDDAISVIFWIDNAADQPPSVNTLSVVSTSALDTSAYFFRFYGFDGSGNPLTIDLSLNGTTTATSASTMLVFSRGLLMSATTNQPTEPNGDITISSGATQISVLLSGYGYKSITAEGKIGVEATQNDTTTIATVAADPSPTFFAANGMGNALSASDGGTLANCAAHSTTPNYQSVWCKLTIPERSIGSNDCQFIPKARVNRI